MPLTFTVRGEPKPQPRPRAFARHLGGGRYAARVYSDTTAEGWKAAIALAAQPHLPPVPSQEPFAVELAFYFTRPKAHCTARGALKHNAPHNPMNKRDVDNLAKAVLDTLTQIGLWRDDGQVIHLIVSKAYADRRPAGADITITPLVHGARPRGNTTCAGITPSPQRSREAEVAEEDVELIELISCEDDKMTS